MQTAIDALKNQIEARENYLLRVKRNNVNDPLFCAIYDEYNAYSESALADLERLTNDSVAELQAAIEVLENCKLIDQDPLNILLVNALRCNHQIQQLLVRNIVERNPLLRVKRDPRVDGLPVLLPLVHWDDTKRSETVLVWHKKYDPFFAEYSSDGYWVSCNDDDERPITTDDILFYCYPSEIV